MILQEFIYLKLVFYLFFLHKNRETIILISLIISAQKTTPQHACQDHLFLLGTKNSFLFKNYLGKGKK